MSKTQCLLDMGFIVGPREPRLNSEFPGKYIVAQSYTDADLPTADGSNGPWAIVGDDLEALVNEAYEFWCVD